MQRDFTTDRTAPGSNASHSKRPWRTAIKWTERVLLAVGVLLLGLYVGARIDSVLRSRAALQQFERLASPTTEMTAGDQQTIEPDVQAGDASTDFTLWSNQRIAVYQEASAALANAPLGVLRIAKVSLVAPILDGTADLTLNQGLGRIAGTSRPGQMGNVGLAGHRDSFFRKLKDVGKGDAIELQTLRGTDTYVVNQIQIVTPDDVSVLLPHDVPSLTLVTCYPFYYVGSAPQRYIITAFLSQEKKNGAGNSDSLAVISNAQKGERQ